MTSFVEGRAVVGDEVLGASQAAEAAVGHQRSQLGNKVTVSAGNARANGGKVASLGRVWNQFLYTRIGHSI